MKKLIIMDEQVNEQVISINGQSQSYNVYNTIIGCPTCNQVLLNVQGSRIDLYKEFAKGQYPLQYCIHCGQELDYPIIIDIECEEVNNE